MTAMFPDLDAAAVLAATEARWDTSGALPVPRPGWLACPVCRHDVVQPRWWRFHTRDDSPTIRGRCDVSIKCCACAAVWPHGVALDDRTYARMTRSRRRPRERIGWREAQKLLAADDP